METKRAVPETRGASALSGPDRPSRATPRSSRPGAAWAGLLLLAVLAAGVLAGVLAGCGQPGDDPSRQAAVLKMYDRYKKADFPGARDLSGGEVLSLLTTRPVVLVDVREPAERAVSTLPGAIPEADFLANRAALANATVVAYCTIGYRSGMFVRGMAHLNATVYNLRGGVLGWLHAGGNLTDPTGRPIQRVHVYGSTWNLAPLRYQAVW